LLNLSIRTAPSMRPSTCQHRSMFVSHSEGWCPLPQLWGGAKISSSTATDLLTGPPHHTLPTLLCQLTIQSCRSQTIPILRQRPTTHQQNKGRPCYHTTSHLNIMYN